jgi:hypothetical protein
MTQGVHSCWLFNYATNNEAIEITAFLFFKCTTKKKVVGMERGPLSLMGTTVELLDRKVVAPV